MPKKVLTPEIEKYIQQNYLTQSGKSIANKFNIGKGVVYRYEKKWINSF